MPALPWAALQPIDPQRRYAVMASRLPLRRYRSIPGFLRDTMAIRRQLAGASGLAGYALDADLAGKTFWTFSAWQDQASLDAFAASEPRREITRKLAARMAPTRFEFFELAGSGLPLPWEQVKARVLAPRP